MSETMNLRLINTNTGRKIVLGIVIISTFIALTTTIIFVYAIAGQGQEIPNILQPLIKYHIEFMTLMGIFGFLSGIAFYIILNATLEKQKQTAKANLNTLLKFLDKNDKEIIKLLIEKGGMTTQTEIAKINNMGRLRAHRMVRKLEEKGIIHVEKHGKINMVRLTEELKQN